MLHLSNVRRHLFSETLSFKMVEWLKEGLVNPNPCWEHFNTMKTSMLRGEKMKLGNTIVCF